MGNVGTRVRELRTERGITMQVLAIRARTSPATISRLERTNAKPKIETLQRIAAELGASVSALLESEES